MAGEGQFFLPGGGARTGCGVLFRGGVARKNEGSFGEIGHARQGLHLLGAGGAAIEDDRQSVAGEGAVGKHIDLHHGELSCGSGHARILSCAVFSRTNAQSLPDAITSSLLEAARLRLTGRWPLNILFSTSTVGFESAAIHQFKKLREEPTCLYESIPKLPTSLLKPRRARSTSTNGSATAGRSCFRTPRISLPYARPNWATWRVCNRSSPNATRKLSA